MIPPSLSPLHIVRFGIFEVDTRSGELRKAGLKIKLHDQPFQVLAMLLERPGELVTREEIRNRLWPSDTFVNDRRRKFHNGNAIEMFHEPNAVTDGDSIVHFRQADVIATGDIFNTTQYPFIDLKDGGSSDTT